MNMAISEAVLAKYAGVRSLDRWKSELFVHDSADQFEAAGNLLDGIHTIVEGDLLIDLYLELKPGCPLVVMFNGAQDRTKTVSLPAFSGLTAVPPDKASRLFINDPTLYLANDISIGWYCGSRALPLQKILPRVIKHVATAASAPRMIFGGGSNGAFASLYYSSLFPGSLAIASNPQTNLVNYYKSHVIRYTSNAFGLDSLDLAKEKLSQHIDSDLATVYGKDRDNCAIYIQNINDAFHLERHCRPFFEALGYQSPDGIMIHQVTERLLLHVADWGNGHVGPKPDYWRQLLSNLIEANTNWRDLFLEEGRLTRIVRESVEQTLLAREGIASAK